MSDGITSYWIDIQSVGGGNLTYIGDSTLQGNIVVGVDSRYSLGSPLGYLKNLYANTFVANTFSITTFSPNILIANTATAGNLTVNTTANIGNVITGGGLFWANGVSALYGNTQAAAYLNTFSGAVTSSNIVSTGNLTASGNIVQGAGYYETFGNITNSGGNITCNFNLGSVFNVTALTTNVTANFSNVNAIPNSVTGAVVIISQGATPYTISNIQINGINQTQLKWVNGLGNAAAPLGLANNNDIISFSMIHLGSGNYRVYGQLSSYA